MKFSTRMYDDLCNMCMEGVSSTSQRNSCNLTWRKVSGHLVVLLTSRERIRRRWIGNRCGRQVRERYFTNLTCIYTRIKVWSVDYSAVRGVEHTRDCAVREKMILEDCLPSHFSQMTFFCTPSFLVAPLYRSSRETVSWCTMFFPEKTRHQTVIRSLRWVLLHTTLSLSLCVFSIPHTWEQNKR